MARFDSDAYNKLFPRKEEVEHVETVVNTFRPTETKLENESVEETSVETNVETDVVDNTEVDSDGNNTDN